MTATLHGNHLKLAALSGLETRAAELGDSRIIILRVYAINAVGV